MGSVGGVQAVDTHRSYYLAHRQDDFGEAPAEARMLVSYEILYASPLAPTKHHRRDRNRDVDCQPGTQGRQAEKRNAAHRKCPTLGRHVDSGGSLLSS
jgi:hypothetical protein